MSKQKGKEWVQWRNKMGHPDWPELAVELKTKNICLQAENTKLKRKLEEVTDAYNILYGAAEATKRS